MATMVIERPVLFSDTIVDPVIAARALAASRVAMRSTLDAVVVAAWEAVTAHRSARCLVCGGVTKPRYGAQGRPVGGRCADCGTTLG